MRIEKISEALEEKDNTALKNVAHRLSGSAGLFGYGNLCGYAADLELAAQEGNLSEAVSLKDRIEREHHAIIKGVEAMKVEAGLSSETVSSENQVTFNA